MSVSILNRDLVAENPLFGLFKIYLLRLAELELVEHGVSRHAIVRHGTSRIIREGILAWTIVQSGSDSLEIQ